MAVLRLPVDDPIARPRRKGLRPGEKDDREGTITEVWIRHFQTLNQIVGNASERITTVSLATQGASIASTAFSLAALSAGRYRVSYFATITRAATTSSSLTVAVGFTNDAISKSFSGTAVTGNTTSTVQSNTWLLNVDATTPITYSTTYASVGATSMQYALEFVVEKVDA